MLVWWLESSGLTAGVINQWASQQPNHFSSILSKWRLVRWLQGQRCVPPEDVGHQRMWAWHPDCNSLGLTGQEERSNSHILVLWFHMCYGMPPTPSPNKSRNTILITCKCFPNELFQHGYKFQIIVSHHQKNKIINQHAPTFENTKFRQWESWRCWVLEWSRPHGAPTDSILWLWESHLTLLYLNFLIGKMVINLYTTLSIWEDKIWGSGLVADVERCSTCVRPLLLPGHVITKPCFRESSSEDTLSFRALDSTHHRGPPGSGGAH